MKVFKRYGANEPRVCMHCGQGIHDHAELERLRALMREAAALFATTFEDDTPIDGADHAAD